MKRVVTFGVYDLLHLGHINLLWQAGLLGDGNTVAVCREADANIKIFDYPAKI